MKRFILPLLCLPLLLAACTKTTTEDDSPESGKPVIATFVYDVDPLADFSNPTRSNGSVDEDVAEDTAINDINLYVWPTDDPSAVIQKYQDSGRGVSLPLTSGTYHVRIVANVGYDMREMDPEVLDQVGSSYLLSEEEQRRILLFAGKKEITLTETERFFNIELKRLFARTYINVQVADAVQSEITLISAQVCNIPTTAVLFGAPPEGAENFPPAVTCTNNSTVKQAYGNRISDLVYTYENLKPSNPAITTQSQRGGSNVPAGATYVHIITHTPEGFFNYMIYLGENNTSNFTIRRNTSTKYDIVIEGINTVDLRVTTTRLYVCDQGDILCDLQTWPPSKSSAVFYYGMYQVNTSEYDVRENLCFVKCKADQHSLDMDATWVDSDPNELLPLTRDNGYIVEVRGYAARVAHPGYRITSFVDFYYGDPADPTQDVASSRLGVDRKYGYSVDFKLEGISYSDFDLIELRSSGVSVLDVTKKTYTDNGTFSIFAYPNESKVNTPHFNLMFSWPSTYKFLGFFNKDGVQFNPTGALISEGDVSWTTNGKGTTTAFWRDANKGSGEVFLRFEKKPFVIASTETNKNSTCKLNRNQITITGDSKRASVKVQFSCTAGQGTFLRNASLNSTTGLYQGTAVTTYEQTCSFTGNIARPAEIVFVPYLTGEVSYKISVVDASSGAVLNEKTITHTIAQSTMEVRYNFASPKENVHIDELGYQIPVGDTQYIQVGWGIVPYKLYAYAVATSGGGLEYWPANLNMAFDTTIDYIVDIAGATLAKVKNPALLKSINRTSRLKLQNNVKINCREHLFYYDGLFTDLAVLEQYASAVFPTAEDPKEIQNISTAIVAAGDITYDGSFQPNIVNYICKDVIPGSSLNVKVSIPRNIRLVGADVTVNLQGDRINPVLTGTNWFYPNYESLPLK